VNTILSVLFALTAMFAPSAQPAQPATFNLPPALTVECQEDMPCWDCHTMGNLTCNVTTEATRADAWNTFDAFDFQPTQPTSVDYVATLDNEPASLPMDRLTLQSTTDPSLWHIYQTAPAQPSQPAQSTQPTASTTASLPAPHVAAQPTASPAQPTASPSTQPTPPSNTDMPSNTTVDEVDTADCDTTGETQCNVPGLGDAWESFDSVDLDYSDAHPLAYSATVHTQPTPSKDTVVIPSTNQPSTWHIFTRH
jgi:hypothetical protein